MIHGIFKVPPPRNEPNLGYALGSDERSALEKRLAEMHVEEIEIPLIIGGKEVCTGRTGVCIEPHDHRHQLGTYHKASSDEVNQAVAAAVKVGLYRVWNLFPYATSKKDTLCIGKCCEISSGRPARNSAGVVI